MSHFDVNSASYDRTSKKIKNVRMVQDICGSVFIVMFTSQFIFQLLIYIGVLNSQDSWYAYVVGILSVIGFVMLYKLASNLSSDVFALCMVGFELFFSIGRPFLLSLLYGEKEYFSIIFMICALFSVLALYFWSVLFMNSKFQRYQWFFILVLPLSFVLNVVDYAGYLSLFENINTISSAIILNGSAVHLLRMILVVFLPIGYWILSHSSSFSGSSEFLLTHTKFTPFNRYFLGYLVLVGILLLPV